MKQAKLVLGLLVVLLVAGGCATTRQEASFPNQSVAVDNPEMARIFVVRLTPLGSAVPMKIMDGDKVIGNTGGHGYLCWEREPGTTEISGHAENTSNLSLTVEKGRTYYIKQNVRMGILFARNDLELVGEDVGRSLVAKCKSPRQK